ncbi:erythromycin esterase family protein [Halomarina halobia]|uniref:Erythromycin esterase family protein n=1 Tax=Halomarina halobia TaxID=3033386 RepID=A0ABD6ADL5_9EURY|nr:erythromycin esterase family protein [Halomarina sp. PSR21]
MVIGRATREEPGDREAVVDEIRTATEPVSTADDLDRLLDRVGDRRYVLLGEASHGTSEFYRWRARLTARLVREHGYDFVAVEGDWPDCYAINRHVKGLSGSGESVREVLDSFDRWPTWMWANWEVLAFLEWLTAHNERRPEGERVGFYGLDVYSLYESMEAVVEYLEDVDPAAAEDARAAYRCFEPYGEDAREYARALRMVPESCEDEVVDVLARLREGAGERGDHRDDRFDAEQNALVARNAEEYYRAMVSGHEDSWNVRDRHMVETLDRLREHHGADARGIVWAHNTHVGDARATDMERAGRLNIGQLARERHGADETALVGFGSYEGSVIAADAWGSPMEEMSVPEARRGSHEELFHRAGARNRLLLSDDLAADTALAESRGHRAIGVVYHPDREAANYVPTVLPDRYDAFVHLDETRALHPLHTHADRETVPELYPTGL